MGELQMTMNTGAEMVLGEGVVEALKASLRGPLLRAGDAGYDEARTIWNGMIDRRPALIARCAGVADVIQCVNFARAHQLLVAVRGGGHNASGNAVCDGGVMLDLSRMKGMRVDPVRRTARAEPGLTWGEFDHETQAFGLATTGGQISTTGIAGLTLGGGWGYLARKYGLASDNLLSADLVTGQRAAPYGQRHRARRPLLGRAGWRRKLWRGHFLRVPAPSRRPGAGRCRDPSVRAGQGGPHVLQRVR